MIRKDTSINSPLLYLYFFRWWQSNIGQSYFTGIRDLSFPDKKEPLVVDNLAALDSPVIWTFYLLLWVSQVAIPLNAFFSWYRVFVFYVWKRHTYFLSLSLSLSLSHTHTHTHTLEPFLFFVFKNCFFLLERGFNPNFYLFFIKFPTSTSTSVLPS